MPSARSMEPTRAELEFLAKLGKWAEPDVTRMSRADLLENYRKAMKKRVEWDGIDDLKIKDACKAMEREC